MESTVYKSRNHKRYTTAQTNVQNAESHSFNHSNENQVEISTYLLTVFFTHHLFDQTAIECASRTEHTVHAHAPHSRHANATNTHKRSLIHTHTHTPAGIGTAENSSTFYDKWRKMQTNCLINGANIHNYSHTHANRERERRVLARAHTHASIYTHKTYDACIRPAGVGVACEAMRSAQNARKLVGPRARTTFTRK